MCPPRVLNCPKRALEAKKQLLKAKAIEKKGIIENKEVVYNGTVYVRQDVSNEQF